MKTSKEIEKSFRKDFEDLLKKYKATFEIDRSDPWSSVAVVYMESKWDSEYEMVSEYTEITLDYEDFS